jgi:restriction system protein
MSDTIRRPVSELPKWHEFMTPLLTILSDGREWQKRSMEQAILDLLKVPQDQRDETLESGQFRALNRIGWATSKLRMAKAITAPQRATFRITDAGRALLAQNSGGISVNVLEAIPAFQEYVPIKGRSTGEVPNRSTGLAVLDSDEITPEERIRSGIGAINEEVRASLLLRLHEGDPYFFERVVRQVLVNMGYGVEGELQRFAGSGDSGIDGVIDQDELGLNRIYIQAKRYAEGNVVGRPMLQGFFGALVTRGASTGVFFTTSRFSAEALDAADRASQNVALVDGPTLTQLMIKHRVGVQVSETIELVKLDEDFFAA